MRSLVLALALGLLATGEAAAQSKTLGPYSAPIGDTQITVSHGQGSRSQGPAAEPGAQTARVGPLRGAHTLHRGHSVRVCIARANARHLRGRAKTRYIHHCEIARR